MFIFNFKFDKNKVSKTFFITALIVVFLIIFFTIYLIFFKHDETCIKSNDLYEITEENYANILKASNENIDSYVGCKVHVIGYVYRLLDFNDNQFVIARDMQFKETGQSLVVGFLCEYSKAKNFSDGTWVEITGEIVKGNFNGDIAMLKILSIKEADKPQNVFVSPPDNTYIPTANIF